MNKNAHAQTYSHTNTHMHTHTKLAIPMWLDTGSDTNAHTDTGSDTNAHADTDADTDADTERDRHTDRRTHRQTHTQALSHTDLDTDCKSPACQMSHCRPLRAHTHRHLHGQWGACDAIDADDAMHWRHSIGQHWNKRLEVNALITAFSASTSSTQPHVRMCGCSRSRCCVPERACMCWCVCACVCVGVCSCLRLVSVWFMCACV